MRIAEAGLRASAQLTSLSRYAKESGKPDYPEYALVYVLWLPKSYPCHILGHTHTHRQASASPSPNSFHGIGHCRGMVEDLLKRSIKQYCSGRITVIFIAVFDFFLLKPQGLWLNTHTHTLFRSPTHQICLPCCSLW